MAAKLWRTPGAEDAIGRGEYATYESFKAGRIDKGKQISLANQVKFPQLWPTPTVNGNNNRAGSSPKAGDGLATAAKMWPTPKSSDAIMGMTARTSGRPIEKSTHLQTQVYLAEQKMWPTPCATEARQGLQIRHEGKKGNQQSLSTAVKLWPTPTAMDGNASLEFRPRKDATNTRSSTLAQRIHMLPTPHANCHTGKSNSQEGAPNLQSFIAMHPTPKLQQLADSGVISEEERRNMAQGNGGQLNPDWVEWLMGLPTGWTDINADVVHPAAPAEGEFWPDEPLDVPRVASEIPNRADRLKGLGNMVVPRQFYPFFKAIAGIERIGA